MVTLNYYKSPINFPKFVVVINCANNGIKRFYAETILEAKKIAETEASKDKHVWHVTIAKNVLLASILTT